MHYKYPHLAHPKYRPDIDGLRAVAVLSVVAFHAFPRIFIGGFIGVDIFFVISGFLISTIILSSLERDRFNLVEFYVRRILRIFPALILMFVATLLLGWFILFSDEFKQLGVHTAAAAGFIQNFILWREIGYFDNASQTKPLLHLWSLVIEEQYYLLWPLLLVFIWRRHWNFLKVTGLIATISFVSSCYLGHYNPMAAFYLPISRFWELMIGGMLAYAALHLPSIVDRNRNGRSILGFGLLVAGFILLNRCPSASNYWNFLPIWGSFFLISAGPDVWLNKKLFGNSLITRIGLISYPLYLWHWPLLTFTYILGGANPSKESRVLAISFAFLLAWITFRFVEKPVRFGKHKMLSAVALLCLMVAILGIGILIAKSSIEPRLTSKKLAMLVQATADWDYPDGLTRISNSANGVYEINNNVIETTLFLGDSHVEQYAPKVVDFINKNKIDSNRAIFVTSGGCLPIPDVMEDAPIHKNCKATRAYGLNLISNKDVKTVVIGACWNGYFIETIKLDKVLVDFDYYTLDGESKHYFRGGDGIELALLKLEEFIHRIKNGKRIVLLLDNPEDERFNPKAYFEGSRMKNMEIKSYIEQIPINPEQGKLKERLVEIAKRQNVEYIDPADYFCIDGMCNIFSEDGNPIYKDSNHIRPYYVREKAAFIENLVGHTRN